jgi:hypothetical protein
MLKNIIDFPLIHKESLSEIICPHDFITKWIYQIFNLQIKMLTALHLKQSRFLPSADKPMSNDLTHEMTWQCMFAL